MLRRTQLKVSFDTCYPLAFWALIAPFGIALADLPRPRLFTVHPAGVQIGKSIEVSLTGERVERLTSLHFSAPGIAAVRLAPSKFRVTVAEDVRPQTVDVVGFGAEGVTNPRAFVVGMLPEIHDVEPNDLREQSQSVPLNVAIHGRIDPKADVDYFRVVVPRSKRACIHAKAIVLDSKLVPAVTVFDERGRRIASTRDYSDFDTPVVVGPFANDQPILIRIHDLIYNGGPEYWYRLEITTGSFAWFVCPAIMPTTRFKAVHLVGWNLPRGIPVDGASPPGFSAAQWSELRRLGCDILPLTQDAITLLPMPGSLFVAPPAAAGDNVVIRPKDARLPDFLVATTRFPIVVESASNDAPIKATKLNLPCEVVGGFDAPTDRDWYRFSAKKGQKVEIAGIAERTGLPGDLAIVVRRVVSDDGKGKIKTENVTDADDDSSNPGGLRFNLATTDPVALLSPSSDSEYLVEISDRYGLHSPRSMYRLRIGPPLPTIRTFVLPFDESNPVGINVERGGNALARLVALISHAPADSPRFTASATTTSVQPFAPLMGPQSTEAGLLLTASATAMPGVLPLVLERRKSDAKPSTEVSQPVVGTIVWPAPQKQNLPARLCRGPVFGVSTFLAPYRLTAPAKMSAVPGSYLRIPVNLQRVVKEFTGPVTDIKPLFPPSVFKTTAATIGEKQTAAVLSILIDKEAALGLHETLLVGTAQVPWPQNPENPKSPKANVAIAVPSNLIKVEVLPAPVKLTLDKKDSSVKPGGTVILNVKLIRLKAAAPQPVKLELTAPAGSAGFSADAVTLAADKSDAKIVVKVGAKVSPADRTTLTIRATIDAGGSTISVDESFTLKVVK